MVHIRRNAYWTFCGLDARFYKVISNSNIFAIAAALEDGDLCDQCGYEAGV